MRTIFSASCYVLLLMIVGMTVHAATLTQALTITGQGQGGGQIPAGCNANGISPNGRVADKYPSGGGATVTLDWNTCFQVIDGFGAGEPLYGMNYTQAEANALYSLNGSGIGVSFERITCNTPQNGDNSCVPGQLIDCGNASLVAGNGARVYALFTSAPSTMITGTPPGSLNTSDYQAYADYMTNYVKGVKSQCGVTLYGLTIQNEPQASNMTWPTDVHDFILNNLVPDLQSNGISLVLSPQESCCENNDQLDDSFVHATYADPATASHIGVVMFHVSNSTSQANVSYLQPAFDSLHGWQTEACFNGADISQAVGCLGTGIIINFAYGSANAWEWEEGAPWGNPTCCDTPQLFDINGVPQIGFYTMGNFSRYIRPGWYEFGATPNPSGNTFTAFFRAPTGKSFAVVAVNQDGVDETYNFSFTGFTAPSVTPIVSSSSLQLAQQSSVTAGSGFSYALPAQSITTFLGTAN